MPIVTVEWFAGRTREQKEAVATRVTAALAEEGGARTEDVWVVFRDVDPGDWAVGGRLSAPSPGN